MIAPLTVPQTRPGEEAGRLSPFYAVAWLLYLLMGPFYIFPSGLPQFADVIASALAGTVLLRLGWRTLQPFSAVVVLLAAFVFYVALVSFGWGMLTGHASIVIKPIYYLFNLLIMVTFLVLYSRVGVAFLRLTLWGISAAVGIQVILGLLLVSGGGGARQSLFFNNPNQLGYYALISIALVAYLGHHIRMGDLHQALFFLGALYLAVLSLSKAALLSVALLFLLQFVRRPLLGLVLVAVAATWVYQVPTGQVMLADLQDRFETVGMHNDDNWAGRGYDRIIYHPEIMILGAAEGAYSRFTSALAGSEMHSTWGTVLFSYGLPGTALFLLFLGLIFRLSGPMAFLYFLPVAIYGLTHNGIRFTMLWVLLAVILCTAHHSRQPGTKVLDRPAGRTLARVAYDRGRSAGSLWEPITGEDLGGTQGDEWRG